MITTMGVVEAEVRGDVAKTPEGGVEGPEEKEKEKAVSRTSRFAPNS